MPETGSSKILYTSRCALVPEQFFEPSSARAMLVETADIDDTDEVSYVAVPWCSAVLIYARTPGDDSLPELYHLLLKAGDLDEHNRIVASYRSGVLYLVVSEDRCLRLCNSFRTADFTTAEYYLFMVLKKFQMNPEVSTVYFRAALTDDQEISLYRYFKAVERI